MNPTISLKEVAERLSLKNFTPELDLAAVQIEEAEINRPALQLKGYFEHFDPKRIQIVGNVEYTYAYTMTAEERNLHFSQLFEQHIPCLIFARGHEPSNRVREAALANQVPLLGTGMNTSAFQARLARLLEVELAPMVAIHGELVDIYGEGVLILGESGIGKSEVALELIKRGHRLVADDTVEIYRFSENELVGRAPEVTRYMMELRGIGIIDIKSLFGVECIKEEMPIRMVLRLVEWARDRKFERLGLPGETVEYLGSKLRCFTVPVSPGRNVAIVAETAALNFRQMRMGYDAMEELERRVLANRSVKE